MKTVTLKQLRDHKACGSETTPYSGRYQHLINALGPDWKDDQPIPLTKILETNGLDDCFWAFWLFGDDPDLKMVAVKFAVFCSKQSLKFRSKKYLDDDVACAVAYAAAIAAKAAKAAKAAAYAAIAATAAADTAAEVRAATAGVKSVKAAADAARSEQTTELKRLLEELK